MLQAMAVLTMVTMVAVPEVVAGAVVRSYASTRVFQILFSWGMKRAMQVIPLLCTINGSAADPAGTEGGYMPSEIRQSETVYSLATSPATVDQIIKVATAAGAEMARDCGA